jgi:hypothetical protein
MGWFSEIVQASFVLIMAYLIIANADKFSTAVNSAGGIYIQAIKALQGR